MDHSDVYHCYNDLWKTAQERENSQYQGIDESDNRNTTRIRVSAGNKNASVAADKATAGAYSNRLYIQLDFDLLESHMPFYQSALGDRLEYEFTFNDYNRLIWATDDTDASYDIENISMEYEMVTIQSRDACLPTRCGTRQRSSSQQATNDHPKWQRLRKTSPWPTYLWESSYRVNSPCGSTSGRLTTTGFMAVVGA